MPLSYLVAQAGAGCIPNCLFRVEAAQEESINRDLYLIQVHDIKSFSP